MCNINILISKNNNTRELKKVYNSFKYATAHSFANNSDGSGYFVNNKYKVSFDYLNLDNLFNDFRNSKVIITHQRIATSGYTIENLQPFISERFVFVHNGVLDSDVYYSDETKSDSHNFFNLFLKEFEQTKEKNDQTKIKSVLKKLFKAEKGYYSIAILDRKTDKIYYIKNSRASISFYLVNNTSLFITTSDTNKIFFTEPLKELIIKNNNLYVINNKDLGVFSIAKFKEPIVYNYYNNYDYDYKYNKYNYKQKKKILLNNEDAVNDDLEADRWAEKDTNNIKKYM